MDTSTPTRERDVRPLLRQEDPSAIPLDVAILCADCPTIHNRPDGACPRCTSRHGIRVERILSRRVA